jgi:hypothetical protein
VNSFEPSRSDEQQGEDVKQCTELLEDTSPQPPNGEERTIWFQTRKVLRQERVLPHVPISIRFRTSSSQEVIEELGEPAFRVKQIESWVWEKNAQSFDEMTNLSKALRAKLEERLSMGNAVELARQISADGSRKYLLQFP